MLCPRAYCNPPPDGRCSWCLCSAFLLKKKIFLLHWVFVASHGLDLVAESWASPRDGSWTSVIATHRLSSHGSWVLKCMSFSLWCAGVVAPWHVESSGTKDQTHVPCISRQILIHWTIREISKCLSYYQR